MAWLYVANPTQQTHKFMYRLPENEGVFQLDIPPGGQIKIPHQLSPAALEYVLDQHRRYGMVEAATAKTFRNFASLIYSVDRLVKHDSIVSYIVSNNDVLVERGRRIQQEAGVAIHEQIRDMMQRNQMPDRLVQVEASAQEDSREPAFAEGVMVSSEVQGGRSEERGRAERPVLTRGRQPRRRRSSLT